MKKTAVLNTRQARVLVVDDERHNREVLEVMLNAEGFATTTAASGEEALALTARQPPDLILLDVMMPGMDGYEVVAKIKSNPATMNIPVVIVTVLNDHNARMLGLRAGAEDFLSKPIDRAELNVRVKNLLRLKDYGDNHRRHGEMLEREVAARTAELVESERRYRQIVESTTDGIVKVDADGLIEFANRGFADMLGHTVPELIGMSALSFVDSSMAAIAKEAFGKRVLGVGETYEITFRRKDGEQRGASVASTPILDEQGRFIGALASARDVTEQKKMIAQLTVSDRMASIGTLAAGVAHEINNPLACVVANLDLAAREVHERGEQLGTTADLSELSDELSDAREAAARICSIVRDLKIFARSEDEATGPVDVTKVMESTLRMAWNEIRHRARLVRNYGDTPAVDANEARLGQVLLNLVVNAAQAIAEGHSEDNVIRIATSIDPSGFVVIEIADTGPGMPPEVLNRLFTPFFTTKPIGVGTGLGLSICHRIVQGLGGSIGVTSAVGKGTTFRVVLPPSHARPAEATPSVALDTRVHRRGRVLIVDDEPMVGAALQRALHADHDVVTTKSAHDAFDRITAGERFDVIICDLMMPQMTGMELHAKLFEIVPEQANRMTFLSGGAFTPRALAFLERTPAYRQLEKPFDVVQLRARINEQIC